MNYIIIVTDCDCIVSFYSFHGTEKDMLSVLKKKAEERRQALAERPEYVTDIEYDELTSSWHINILLWRCCNQRIRRSSPFGLSV